MRTCIYESSQVNMTSCICHCWWPNCQSDKHLCYCRLYFGDIYEDRQCLSDSHHCVCDLLSSKCRSRCRCFENIPNDKYRAHYHVCEFAQYDEYYKKLLTPIFCADIYNIISGYIVCQ